jgi:RNA polymerase sigma-70 factor, ECF subfamily
VIATNHTDTPALFVPYEAFYHDHYRRVLALAYGVTGSWGDAEDLTQDAFAAAFRKWRDISAYEDPVAWVKRCVVNRSVSRWRRLAAEARTLTRAGARTRSNYQDPDPPDPDFWRAVHTLPAAQRQVIALFYVEDMDTETIASLLDRPLGTVKSQLGRARGALHEQLTSDPKGTSHE